MRATLLLSLIAATCPSLAMGQTAGSLPRVLDLPASTRAMALGDAYVMDAEQSDAVFYHPALLTVAGGFGIEYQRWGAHSSAVAVSAATQWFGTGIGVGLTTLQYGAPGTGASAAPAGQDHLFDLGPNPVSERVAVLGAAREMFGVDFGLGVKLVEERIEDTRDAELLLDLGAAREIGPVTVGLTIRDVGEAPIVGSGGTEARRVVLGVGTYGRQLGILDYGFAAATTFEDDDVRVSGGLEIGYWPIQGRTFVARIGLREVPNDSDASPLTIGFAFWGDELVLEWAFQPLDGAANAGTHRLGVRWQ